MLTRAEAGGLFVGAPTTFNARGDIDFELFRGNIRRYLEAGIRGIWILGSSGQVQTVNDEEFGQLVSALVEEVDGRAVTVVGCSAPGTRESLERVRIAADRGADAVLNTLPYFVQLRKAEAVRYFQDIADAYPGIGIFHYNTPRAGTLLDPEDYTVLAEIPSFLGSKQVSTDGWLWMELERLTPELAHWGVDGAMLLASTFGSRGVWSAIGMWAPSFALDAFQHCLQGDLAGAKRHQHMINAFLSEVARPLVSRGYLDPVVDKTFSEICGFTEPGDLRRPFLPMEPEDQDWAREMIHARHRFLLEHTDV